MERVLVTGGTGLVGSFIICELLKSGVNVLAMKRQSSDMSWFEHLAKTVLKENFQSDVKRLDWIDGEITDAISVLDCVKGCNKVFHCAGLVSFNDSDRLELMAVNSGGTANVVNACLAQNTPPQLCYISSTATMGKPKGDVIDETCDYSLQESKSAYAQSKYLGELEAFRGREEGLEVAIINPSVVLGFGNWHSGSSKLFKNAFESFPFYTDGGTAFVDVRDVARASIKLISENHFKGRFLCTGHNLRFLPVFSAMSQAFQTKPPRIHIKPWMTQIAWRLSAIKRLFGGRALITKSSAKAAMRKTNYSSARLEKALNFSFTSNGETIAFHCGLYKSFSAYP